LRDIHHLKDQYRTDEDLWTWAAQVKACYERTCAYTGPSPGLTPRQHQKERAREQHRYEQEVWALCQPYAHTDAPMHTLCERIERFLPELFLFVAVAGVPSHNNLAERSVRPLVIARKISGGSRSPKGSHPRMSLAICSAPGWRRDSIRFESAWLCSPNQILYHNPEQYPARLTTWNTGHVLLYSIQDSGEESIAYCDAHEDRCTIGASDFRRT
jgi:hypothetical protein